MVTSLVIALALQTVQALPEKPFDEALRLSSTTGRPLVILLGAEWCPACITMRKEILPKVAKAGTLDQVEFTYVDVDRDPQLARHLSRNTAIPQLLRLEKSEQGWTGTLMLGAQSPEKVKAFIRPKPVVTTQTSAALGAVR